ncbi:hypothetical protein [Streptomyces sp. enrichment culture]
MPTHAGDGPPDEGGAPGWWTWFLRAQQMLLALALAVEMTDTVISWFG